MIIARFIPHQDEFEVFLDKDDAEKMLHKALHKILQKIELVREEGPIYCGLDHVYCDKYDMW